MNSELLWTMLTKGSVIVGLAWVASLALRRASASKRHAVWLGVVLATLLLPLAEVRLPDWPVSVERSSVVAPFVVPLPLRASLTYVPRSNGRPIPLSSWRPVPPSSFDWGGLLPKVWFAGFLLVLAYSVLGHLRVAHLVRGSRVWQPERLDLKPIRVRLTPGLDVPATCGLFRPLILLPESATGWSREQIQMAVAHELGHIRRHDWLWQIAAQFAVALNFFNPLVWLAARQLRKESELACDDFVLLQGIEPIAYAQLLLSVAGAARRRFASSAVGMAQSGDVEARLRSIVDADRRRSMATRRILAVVLGATALICLPLAALRAHRSGDAQRFAPLPEIPHVESPQVRPNDYEASNWVASLPNGFRVRLIGASAPMDYLWGADGKKLSDSDQWTRGEYALGKQFHLWTWGIDRRDRYFYIEVEAPRNVEAMISYQTNEDDTPHERRSALSYSHDLVQFQAREPQYAKIDLNHVPPGNSIVFRVGVAAGWHTIATLKNPYHGPASGIVPASRNGGNVSQGCGVLTDGIPEVFYQYAPNRYKRVDIEPNHLDNSISRRVLAYDAEGREVELPKDDRIDLDPAVFCKIDKFVLQTSEPQWAEFRNVPVKPDLEEEDARRLDPGIRGVAQGVDPAFVRHLSDGVTVSLASVTAAGRDGSLWRFAGQPSWQPSGAVLATPQTPEKDATLTPLVGPNVPVFFRVLYDNLPGDANTVVRASGELSRFFGADPANIPGPTRSGPMSRLAYFDPDARSTELRVGVATGPWHTAYRYQLQPSDAANSARAGLSVRMGSTPTVRYGGSREAERIGSTPLGDVSMRLVAITRSGEKKVLRPTSWVSYGAESFDIPPKGGQAWSPSGLFAQDIAGFRIDTRPYEWVTFPGVSLKPKP